MPFYVFTFYALTLYFSDGPDNLWGLLLLTSEILSLPFDPQDNVFLSWAHAYATFHNQSNCWVCGAFPSSSVEGFLWWTSPLQGKDFLQVCKYLQQLHVMPLLKLMTSNNLKMDWCNTLYFNYGQTWLLILIIHGLSLMTILLHIRQIGLDLIVFYLTFIKYGMRLYG